MIRIAFPAALAASLFALAPAVPAAGGGATAFVGSTEISVLTGNLWLDDVFVPAEEDTFFARASEVSLDGGFLWGVRLGHRFTRRVQAEATLGFASGAVHAERDGQGLDVTDLTTVVYNLDALYYLPFGRESFEPYIAAGLGGTSYRPASRADLDRTSSLTGNAGGGVRVYLSDKLAVRADARYYVLSFDRNEFFRRYPNFSRQLDDRTLNHAEVSLGLVLRFFDTDLF